MKYIHFLASLSVIGLLVVSGGLFYQLSSVERTTVADLGGIRDSKCSVSSTEVVSIGDDISTQVLASAENRAYARIQTVANESVNAVYLSFDEGAAAVVGEGARLATSTDSRGSVIEFGRNADMPYIGAVTAITDVASTTVLVTDCLY